MTTLAQDTDRYSFERRESKMNGDTFAGLEYDTELINCDGVCVTLYVTEQTTKEQIEAAKRDARNKRDVAGRFYLVQVPQAWLDAEKPAPSTHEGGWIAAARWIKEHHSARRVDPKTGELIPENKRGGMLLDAFSASALTAVYDSLSEQNKAKLLAMPVARAVEICFQCLNDTRK